MEAAEAGLLRQPRLVQALRNPRDLLSENGIVAGAPRFDQIKAEV
jgi:hypothetical protein